MAFPVSECNPPADSKTYQPVAHLRMASLELSRSDVAGLMGFLEKECNPPADSQTYHPRCMAYHVASEAVLSEEAHWVSHIYD